MRMPALASGSCNLSRTPCVSGAPARCAAQAQTWVTGGASSPSAAKRPRVSSPSNSTDTPHCTGSVSAAAGAVALHTYAAGRHHTVLSRAATSAEPPEVSAVTAMVDGMAMKSNTMAANVLAGFVADAGIASLMALSPAHGPHQQAAHAERRIHAQAQGARQPHDWRAQNHDERSQCAGALFQVCSAIHRIEDALFVLPERKHDAWQRSVRPQWRSRAHCAPHPVAAPRTGSMRCLLFRG